MDDLSVLLVSSVIVLVLFIFIMSLLHFMLLSVWCLGLLCDSEPYDD